MARKRLELGTCVILAHMGTLAPDGCRHIDAVIDEKRHAQTRSDPVKAPSSGDQVLGAAGLVAKLDDGDPASDGFLDDFDQVPRPEDLGRRVRHQIQRVVDRNHAGVDVTQWMNDWKRCVTQFPARLHFHCLPLSIDAILGAFHQGLRLSNTTSTFLLNTNQFWPTTLSLLHALISF
jgi:hypothetical protein